ncbi:MAG: outer membrane beta-barrel protein [Paludibacter sp.]|nr:outer membrane beta-barrel protein [Paludibacter sp.]
MKKLIIISLVFLTTFNLFAQTVEKLDSLPDDSTKIIDLQEVVIEKALPQVINKFDRRVFPVSDIKKSGANTVLDLLRTLPGVVVDEDGNIRFKGATATVLVDEQPLDQVFGSVEVIPVEQIEKIELIDPAMRSGGAGRGGIINIVLKKAKIDGLSGLFSANASTLKFNKLDNYRAFANLNYKVKDWLFFVNSGYEYLSMWQQENSNISVDIDDYKSYQTKFFDGRANRRPIYNYLGAVYSPSEKTKFYITGHYLRWIFQRNITSNLSETDPVNQSVINKYLCTNSLSDKQINAGLYISYWHKIDTLDSYISIEGGYGVHSFDDISSNDYDFQYLNYQNIDSLYFNKSISTLPYKNLYIDAFYNKSISKTSRFNISYNLDGSFYDSASTRYFIFNNLSLPESQLNKNVLALHHTLSIRYGFEKGKWKIDAGVNFKLDQNRADFVRYKQNSQDTTLHVCKNYFRLLPSATIVFALNSDSEIKLSLAQTSESPYYSDLCDFVNKQNIYRWKTGNSALKIVDFYSTYIGYLLEKEKFNASFEYFFNFTNNESENLDIPVTSLIYLNRPENIATKAETGIDLSFLLLPNNNLNFQLSSSIFHTYFDLKKLMQFAQGNDLQLPQSYKRDFGYYVKFSTEYKLKTFYSTFYTTYYAKELTFEGCYNNAYLNSSLSIGNRFLNNRLAVSLGLRNFFADLFKHGSYSNSLGIVNDTQADGSNYKMLFNLSMQYKFNQGDRGTKDLQK